MVTVSCNEIWAVINSTEKYLPKELYDRLCDTFCTFECSWPEHAAEYHTDKESRHA